MGSLSIPIYAYHNKWSGAVLKLCAIPDAHKPGAIRHLYLDLVQERGGIPLQLTTDKGSEIGWQTTVQSIFREVYVPHIDTEIYPPSVALPSTCNMIIESLWWWLCEKVGLNIKDMILVGKHEHCFHAHDPLHHDLFYWIFVPLIQQELDWFRDYWNNHKIHKQANKEMISGHSPDDALHHPSLFHGTSCLVCIPEDAQAEMWNILDKEVGQRDEHLSWYSTEFCAGLQLYMKHLVLLTAP
ncbi:hypothetical protein P691DRAFT_767413 [Macrolepiota fuliginosa MF-IS2]|uniref:Integrase core domain-containing protein n=1 Tax=Macrolepiota fuliginosa MF-IS2 TaxID=1400762 RepID=A0A9P6BUT5_9AGAR|nr:hypothetical protein P691DRAFT_767413 [Macrolepiota fuliginosa MF-IS2]